MQKCLRIFYLTLNNTLSSKAQLRRDRGDDGHDVFDWRFKTVVEIYI